MPSTAGNEPKEFLIVVLPEKAEAGTNLRLLGIESTLASAEKAVDQLDSGTLGKVAVLERRAVFLRQPRVESVPVTDRIAK